MKYYTQIDGVERVFEFHREGGQLFATSGDRRYALDLAMTGDGSAFSLLVDGRSADVVIDRFDGGARVQLRGEVIKVLVEDERERTAHEVAGAKAGGKRTVTASMPGVVVDVLVAEGDTVEDGQTLLVLEAMKMQNPIQAEGAGTVAKLHVEQGQALAAGAALVDLDE